MEQFPRGRGNVRDREDVVVRVAVHHARLHLYPVEFAEPGLFCALQGLPHELVRDADRDVEILDVPFALFRVDEVENVRVVHPHHRHVRAVTPLLFDDAERHVVDLQERDGARGHAAGTLGARARRTEHVERKAEAGTRLLKKRRVLQGREDAVHAVVDVEHDAVRHERRGCPRVRDGAARGRKFEARHDAVELVGALFDPLVLLAVLGLHERQGLRGAPEHLLRRFRDGALRVALEIAVRDDRKRVQRKGQRGVEPAQDIALLFADKLALLAVEDVRLGRFGEPRGDKLLFHHVLHSFDGRELVLGRLFLEATDDGLRHALCGGVIGRAYGLKGLADGKRDALPVEGRYAAVPFLDGGEPACEDAHKLKKIIFIIIFPNRLSCG